MRLIPRMLASLALAGGLTIVPASGAIHAAPGHGKPAAGTHRVNKDTQSQVSFSLDQIASVVGVSTAVLQQDLQAGQTLLQIAGSKYSSAGDLATALLANVKAKLDRAVAAGMLTADQESQMYGKLLSDAETLVVTPHPRLAAGDTGQKGGFGMVKPTILSTLVTSCHTTAEALSSALQAGDTSVLAACQVTNPSATEESLATAITAAVRTQLDTDVSSGQITAERESALLAQLQANLSDMLTTPAGAHHTDKKA